jgi:hypothetical protein
MLHVCLYFQDRRATAKQPTIVNQFSAFQVPPLQEGKEVKAADTISSLYRLSADNDQKATDSDVERVQAFHDVCALWGSDNQQGPPRLLPTFLEEAVKQVEKDGFVSGQVLKGIEKQILRPQTKGKPPIPTPLLLYGPTGTGKTKLTSSLLPRAGVRILWYGTGSQLNSKWVGETEQALIQHFEACHETPNILCALVIDEIDTLTGKRSGNTESDGKDGHRLDWISLMLRLVGSEDFPNLLVVGMTNRESAMDDAFVRFGRFGTCFFIGSLNADSRYKLLQRLLEEAKITCPWVLEEAWTVAATLGFTAAMIVDLAKQCVAACEDEKTTCIANNTLAATVRAVIEKRRSVPTSLLYASSTVLTRARSCITDPPKTLLSINPLLEMPHHLGCVPPLSQTRVWWCETQKCNLTISTPTGTLSLSEARKITDERAKSDFPIPFDGLVVGFAQQTFKVEFLVVVGGIQTSTVAATTVLTQAQRDCASYAEQGRVLLWINADQLLEWQKQEIVTETKGTQTTTQDSPASVSNTEHWTVSKQAHGQLVHQSVKQAFLDLVRRFQNHKSVLLVVETDNVALFDELAVSAGWTVSLSKAKLQFDATLLTGNWTNLVLNDKQLAITSDASASWRTGFTTCNDTPGAHLCWVKVHHIHKDSKIEIGLCCEKTADGKWTPSSSTSLSQQSTSEAKFAAWKLWIGKLVTHAGERPFSAARKVLSGDTLGMLFLPTSKTTANVIVWHNNVCFGELAVGFPVQSPGYRWAVSLYHPKGHVEISAEPVGAALAHVPRAPPVQWCMFDTSFGIRANEKCGFVTTKAGWQTTVLNRTIKELKKGETVYFGIRVSNKDNKRDIWLGLADKQQDHAHHLGQQTISDSIGLHLQTRAAKQAGKDLKADEKEEQFIREQLAYLENHPAYKTVDDVAGVNGNWYARQNAFKQRILDREAAQTRLNKADEKLVQSLTTELAAHKLADQVAFGLSFDDEKNQVWIMAHDAVGTECLWGSFPLASLQSKDWCPAISVTDESVQVTVERCELREPVKISVHQSGGCVVM